MKRIVLMGNSLYFWIMFTSLQIRIVLRNGLIAGTLIIVFAYLKNKWLIAPHSPDLILTLMALIFITAGFFIQIPQWQNKMEQKEIILPVKDELLISLLSKREMAVCILLISLDSNKEIADKLCIEVSTLKSHINSIYKKLQVKNRKELKLKYPADKTLNYLKTVV